MSVLLVATFNVKPDRFNDFRSFFSDFKHGYAQQDQRLQSFRMFRKTIAAERTGEVLSVEEFANLTDCGSYLQEINTSPDIAEDDAEWEDRQMTIGSTAFEIWIDRTPAVAAAPRRAGSVWSIHTVQPLPGKTASMLRFLAELLPLNERAGNFGGRLYQAVVAGADTGIYHHIEEYDDLAHFQTVADALASDPEAAAYMERWMAERPIDGPVNATILTEILL